MTRTVDDVIADWTLRQSGRTRYEGQEPRDDELMLAEVMRLRRQLEQVIQTADGIDDRNVPPKRIWLLLGEGDEGSHIWSDDPDPSGSGDHIAVEYVRAAI